MYLDQSLFYPENNGFQSFCKWNTWPYEVSEKELFLRIKHLICSSHQSFVILILNHPMECCQALKNKEQRTLVDGLEIEYLNSFSGAIVKSENYYLYKVQGLRILSVNHE
jgi:hypothetical protein